MKKRNPRHGANVTRLHGKPGELPSYAEMFLDGKSGIVWIEDHSAGVGHSAHPNISATGSVRGMRDRGYWLKSDRVVRSHGWNYNIDSCTVSDKLDKVAAKYCRCGGNHACAGGTQNPFDLASLGKLIGTKPLTVKLQKVAGQIQLSIEKPTKELLRKLGVGRSHNPGAKKEARVYVKLRSGKVETHKFKEQSDAYHFWLGLPPGLRAAFRGIGDNRPVQPHDYVTRH